MFYAKEGKKKMLVDSLIPNGADRDVYEAQTPSMETQGSREVREDKDVQVEMPMDQTPAEIVKED